jgi:hypothetical protein
MPRSDRPDGAGSRLLTDARAAGAAPPASPPSPPAALPRSAEDLAAERGGYAAWCGPAVVALATGRPYAEACALIRRAAPDRYPEGKDLATAYWRDLIAALALAGVPAEAAAAAAPGAARAPTLVGLARRGGLVPGWYLVRVTGHFLLLRLHGFGLQRFAARSERGTAAGRCPQGGFTLRGDHAPPRSALAQVFDNRLSGAVLSARTHGRRRVTHLARIAGGPLPGAAAA